MPDPDRPASLPQTPTPATTDLQRLRGLVYDIADSFEVDLGDAAEVLRAIVARCRAEVERWDEDDALL